MSNNEKILMDEIKELKEIVNNYQERDIVLLTLCKKHIDEIYQTKYNMINSKSIDDDIIVDKFKKIINREKDLHNILHKYHIPYNVCGKCGKVSSSGKISYHIVNNIYYCSKKCFDT